MRVDWFQTGKEKTEGREEDFLKLFDAVQWRKPPIETGYTQGYAFRSIFKKYKTNATHVGEAISPEGSVLAVRTKYAQGIAEIFFLDDVSVIVPLVAKKYWEEGK